MTSSTLSIPVRMLPARSRKQVHKCYFSVLAALDLARHGEDIMYVAYLYTDISSSSAHRELRGTIS
eukprot:4426433-Amphidinium_carterae.2